MKMRKLSISLLISKYIIGFGSFQESSKVADGNGARCILLPGRTSRSYPTLNQADKLREILQPLVLYIMSWSSKSYSSYESRKALKSTETRITKFGLN